MVIVWIVLAFACGASFGVMLTAGVMLAAAVNKHSDKDAETLFEGRSS